MEKLQITIIMLLIVATLRDVSSANVKEGRTGALHIPEKIIGGVIEMVQNHKNKPTTTQGNYQQGFQQQQNFQQQGYQPQYPQYQQWNNANNINPNYQSQYQGQYQAQGQYNYAPQNGGNYPNYQSGGSYGNGQSYPTGSQGNYGTQNQGQYQYHPQNQNQLHNQNQQGSFVSSQPTNGQYHNNGQGQSSTQFSGQGQSGNQFPGQGQSSNQFQGQQGTHFQGAQSSGSVQISSTNQTGQHGFQGGSNHQGGGPGPTCVCQAWTKPQSEILNDAPEKSGKATEQE